MIDFDKSIFINGKNYLSLNNIMKKLPQIIEKNLCHMLGIDFNNIKGDYFNEYRQKAFGTSSSDFTSYDLLCEIIDNMDKISMLDNDASNNAKAINYYKSAIKCAIFNKLSNFDSFNFASANSNGNQRFLFVPSNEAVAPYFMMGIDLDQNMGDKYFVHTLVAPEDPKNYFSDREIVIPTQILVSNDSNLTKMVATPEEKLQLINMYYNLVNQYNVNSSLNIQGDYESMLNDLSKTK